MKGIKNSLIRGFLLLSGCLLIGFSSVNARVLDVISKHGLSVVLENGGLDHVVLLLLGFIFLICGLLILIAEFFTND